MRTFSTLFYTWPKKYLQKISEIFLSNTSQKKSAFLLENNKLEIFVYFQCIHCFQFFTMNHFQPLKFLYVAIYKTVSIQCKI